MENKHIIIVCGVVIAIALIIATATIGFPLQENSNSEENNTNSTSTVIIPQEEDSNNEEDSDIVKEEIKFNYQQGEGYYKEITYKDGNFRQYDVQTGELIGSSFKSDNLPGME